MTGLARQHAIEVCRELRLPADKILGAYDIVESVLGADWLSEQELQAKKHRVKISDAHTLVRILATPTHEAHAEICELALYLQAFASDPAINAIIQDLRTPKYGAVLMELAFAYRWRDGGAKVRLRPTTVRGEADFEAVISGMPYVVETSLFPDEVFKQPRFRLPQIIGQAIEKSSFRGSIKVFVAIREYPPGNIDSQVYEVVTEVCRQFWSGGATSTVSRDFAFAYITIEPITGDPAYNLFLEAVEEEPWDICFQHVTRRLPVGQPIYRAIEHKVVEEAARIFVKFPEADRDIYEAIHRKLRKEVAQLSGVKGPRIVVLDTGALGDIRGYNESAIKAQMARVVRNIPELACVWISMRKFLREYRHRYFSIYIPNPESIYQLPNAFLTRCAMREWRWDFLADEEFSR